MWPFFLLPGLFCLLPSRSSPSRRSVTRSATCPPGSEACLSRNVLRPARSWPALALIGAPPAGSRARTVASTICVTASRRPARTSSSPMPCRTTDATVQHLIESDPREAVALHGQAGRDRAGARPAPAGPQRIHRHARPARRDPPPPAGTARHGRQGRRAAPRGRARFHRDPRPPEPARTLAARPRDRRPQEQPLPTGSRTSRATCRRCCRGWARSRTPSRP